MTPEQIELGKLLVTVLGSGAFGAIMTALLRRSIDLKDQKLKERGVNIDAEKVEITARDSVTRQWDTMFHGALAQITLLEEQGKARDERMHWMEQRIGLQDAEIIQLRARETECLMTVAALADRLTELLPQRRRQKGRS